MVVASVRQQSSGCLVAQRPLDPLLALLPPATSAGVGSVSAEPDFLHVHAVGLCSGTLLRTAWAGGAGGVGGWGCGGGCTVHRWLRSAVIVSAVIQSFHSGGNNNTVINLWQRILSPAAETNSQRDTITASWGRRGGGGVLSHDWIMMFNTSCLNSLQCSKRRLSLLDG